MADPFATGLGTLFRGPRAVAAVYVSIVRGGMLPIRVIRHQPTEDLQLGDTTVPVESTILEIARSDLPAPPIRGDVVQIGDEELEIVGEPRLDRQGIKWLCEAPPPAAITA